jgi:hypothetical protein
MDLGVATQEVKPHPFFLYFIDSPMKIWALT